MKVCYYKFLLLLLVLKLHTENVKNTSMFIGKPLPYPHILYLKVIFICNSGFQITTASYVTYTHPQRGQL